MLQLDNSTPFAAAMALFPDPDAIDTLYVIVRASFDIGPRWTLADEQPPPVEADVYWGEPETSSLKYASDYHVGKPGTDIVMLGRACAADRRAVTELDVSLSVGELRKTIRVYGDRHWRNGAISAPLPFETMPLVYEKAFGGKYLVDGEIESVDERNPVGCGYAGQRSAEKMEAVPLPNLEDPNHLIASISDRPPPAGFGFYAPAWKPRVAFAGTYDAVWQKERAPFLPRDFDRRFLNMAHPDLICRYFLQGGERVTIHGMHPDGVLDFELPRITLKSRIRRSGRDHAADFVLETLLLEPNQYRLSMVWKAAHPCARGAQEIERIRVALGHSAPN